ncbi:MAG: hypothetical protein ACOYIF_00970 [Acetivibrionales bacterium]|jgi:hypothetical protein
MAYLDYCICFVEGAENRVLAENMVSAITSYTLPKKVHDLKVGTQYKNGCTLAVSSDSPLTAEQVSILSACRWLMVVCNDRDRDALGISQAINYFLTNRDREFILPILFNGEPQTAFPPEFFEERKRIITFNDGATQEITEIVEPLAIDVRSKNIKSSLSLLKQARIKIVAALIGVSYDALVQRHEKRTRQRLKIIASVIILLPILLGSFFTYLWFNSKHKTEIAIQKTQLSKDLLADMCQNYPLLFQNTPEIQPYISSLLVNSLEKLRVAESEYISLLPVDELLLPEPDDDLSQSRNKAKILRYLGKKEEAVQAYKITASKLEQGSELYSLTSGMFVINTEPKKYPNGILVIDISDDVSKECDGLSVGDVIVETGGFKFRDFGQYQAYLSGNAAKNKNIKLTILRLKENEFSEMVLSVKPENLVFKAEEM